jgi:glycosyltransferase involved in cell wall biosynthesis
MNVLIGCAKTLNPFVGRLRQAIADHPQVDTVSQDLDAFWEGEADAEVLHLQWPRALFRNWRDPTSDDLAALETRLADWKKKARIVVTVHNIRAHNRSSSPSYDDLYRLVYRHADGFIHMGNASKRKLHEAYQLDAQREAVIEHGEYDTLPNTVTRKEARRRVGVPGSAPVALVFGALREPEEMKLVLEGTDRWSAPGKQTLVAGRLTWTEGALQTHPVRWYYRLRTLHRPIRFTFDRFDDEQLQYFLKAADVLFIARRQILNSGNVPLGFTFGRVVVGPDRGVVGEVLRRTGNPVFDPEDASSIGSALDEATALAEQGKGGDNADYAKAHMKWSDIADQHVQFYRALRSSLAA